MKKHRDCTVPAQNYSQFALTLGDGQQINTYFRFIGNANRYVHMCYAIPFIVIPYMFWVRVMPKFRIAKGKEKQDTVKRPQQKI